jgi:hypothetical protein
VNVWDNTSTSDGGFDKGVQFFVTTDRKLQVAGSDAFHFKVFGCVTGQFKNFSGEVLQDGGGVDGRGGANALLLGHTLFQVTVNTANWELKTSARRAGLRLFLGLGCFTTLATFSSFSSFSGLNSNRRFTRSTKRIYEDDQGIVVSHNADIERE